MLTEITSLERYTSFTSPEHYESPGSQTRGPEMWSPIPRVPQSVGQSSPQSGVGRGTGRFPCGAGGSPVLVGWLEEQGSCPMASRSPGLRGDHQAYGGRADPPSHSAPKTPTGAQRTLGAQGSLRLEAQGLLERTWTSSLTPHLGSWAGAVHSARACSLWVCFRNWCSYVVTRTISCHVQNGTYLQRVLQNCPWPMSCPGSR